MQLIREDYFPSKLAKGEQFCNREQERKLLTNNIAKARHTVLVSPRRYGKSSLVHQVVLDIDMPVACIDMFLAHDDKAIIKRLLKGIGEAVAQLLPPTDKFLSVVERFFKNFKVSLAAKCFNIDIAYEASALDAVDQVFDALQSLVEIAAEKNKRIILFIDEFQDIASAESSKSIQGAIRHIAQDTSDVIFIFSGSNRHLLLELFDDSSLPLYMLCDKIHLHRMTSDDYRPFLQKKAIKRWSKEISKISFSRIMTLTEMHTFYVNMICEIIWQNDEPPSTHDVMQAWQSCYELEERRLISDIEKLSINQQNLMKLLSRTPVVEPTGQTFISAVGMAPSSIRQVIKVLLEKDMLYKVRRDDSAVPGLKPNQLRILDPLLSFAMRKYN